MNGRIELAPGVQLGSYVLDTLLGEGGMAQVYRAHHQLLGTPAAVKVIEGRGDPGPEHAERFRREARSLFKLKHPNIVQFLEFGVAEDVYYLTVEYVEGADLAWVVRRYRRLGDRMPAQDVVDTIRQVADGLDYIHHQGIVHRDVKPSNILLDRDGHVLLTDFGLALSATDSTVGAIFGSAHYVSPEQALSSHNAVPQSDVYSLGVVAYELLVGKVPFEKDTALAVALQHINDPVPPPRHLQPDLDPALEAAVLRALAKRPAKRYASASDFARALVQAAPMAAEASDPQPPSPPGVPTHVAAMEGLPARQPGTGVPLRQVVAEHPAPAADTHRPVDPARMASPPSAATVLAGVALLALTLGLAAYLLLRGVPVDGGSGALGRNPAPGLTTEKHGSLAAPSGRDGPGQAAEDDGAAADIPIPSAAGMNIASCHGYRFVSRLAPGRYAFAIWRTPVYDRPRYEHDPERGVVAAVLTELAPGDRVLVLDHETYPNCFKEARFWKVQTDTGIVGWAPEWRYYYFLEP